MIQRTHNQFHWRLADDFAPLLEAVLGAPPEVVKESAAKLVARHEVNGRAFYVKRYRHGAFLFRPLKFLIKRSQAEQEWWLAAEMEKRGVRTVRHLALGERWSARGLLESVLITEGFDGGVPLGDSHESHFRRVIEFVSEIARAGVTHFDLHPSNLLLNEVSGEMRLIDLHGAKVFDNEMPTDCRDVMLVQLCATLALPVGPDLARLSGGLRTRQFAERSNRCLKTNRDFAREQIGGLCWNVRRDALIPEVQAVLRDPDAFLTRAKLFKNGRAATVGAADGLVLKRYNRLKLLNPLKDVFRGSPARRGFRKSYHLELCGFPTPAVAATADRRVLGMPVCSYVLMAEIPDAVDAARWSGDVAKELGFIVAWLHAEGFTHRDLKPANILFDAKGRPSLIDLDGLAFVRTVTPLDAAGNLRRLAEGMAAAGKLTRRNVITFLHIYCRMRMVRPRVLFPRA